MHTMSLKNITWRKRRQKDTYNTIPSSEKTATRKGTLKEDSISRKTAKNKQVISTQVGLGLMKEKKEHDWEKEAWEAL